MKLPDVFDFSQGSTNPYLVESRHRLIPPCLHCHKFVPVKLDGSSYYRYFVQGLRIEDCFPTLTMPERELLITGIHPDCWEALMAVEED